MNLAIFSPSQNPYSETFIQAHKNCLKADKVFYIYGRSLENMIIEQQGLLLESRFRLFLKGVSKISKQSLEKNYNKVVAKKLKKLEVDVALVEYGNHAMKLIEVLKSANIPFIAHFHGYDISVHKVIEQHNNYELLFNSASYIMAVSKVMKQRILDMGCPKEKIVYNVYGANPVFESIKPKFSKKQVFAVGRFVDKKAPYYTIMAFKQLIEKHTDAKLIMAGRGYLFNMCQNLIKHYNLQESVKLLGVVSPNQIKGYLEESYCFVQHSIKALNGDQEGTPVAIMEAAIAGLPVVSTYHAGIQDVIEHEETGLLCEEHDVNKMAENLIRLFDDVEYAKRLGLQAKKYHIENYSLKRHIKSLQNLINDLA
jgi:glycosyltransferase involved in cell wall biosynthesis